MSAKVAGRVGKYDRPPTGKYWQKYCVVAIELQLIDGVCMLSWCDLQVCFHVMIVW